MIRGMQKKQLLWLVPVALAAAWIYALGRSADGLRALLDSAADSAVIAAEPSAPLDASSSRRDDEPHTLAQPAAARSESPPVPMPRETAPPRAQLAPAVYADGSRYAALAGADEPLEHPEITDPHMRKLLQPAWDD